MQKWSVVVMMVLTVPAVLTVFLLLLLLPPVREGLALFPEQRTPQAGSSSIIEASCNALRRVSGLV